ncbi:MAG: hypothetical protein Tsb0032_01960 [Kiloniellaceae bacterium]
MIRLTEISGEMAGSTAVRWDQRSVDVLSVVQTARTLRADFIADHLHRGTQSLGALARWSGLADLFAALKRRHERRRTLKALTQLDDRLLADIGISRAAIEATADDCCGKEAVGGTSVWTRLTARLRGEVRRRRTIRELSAMSDELLADIGISRAEIPAVAAALMDEQPQRPETGESQILAANGVVADMPIGAQVSAEILAFVELRRSAQRAANQNLDRPAA